MQVLKDKRFHVRLDKKSEQNVSVHVTETGLKVSTADEGNTYVCFNQGGLKACYKEKSECIRICQKQALRSAKNASVYDALN